METVNLKNGSIEALSLVQITRVSIFNLVESDPISAFELVEIARNPDYKPFGLTGKKLKNLSLIETENGDMHSSVRNIVLSMAQGEGLNLYFVDPIA